MTGDAAGAVRSSRAVESYLYRLGKVSIEEVWLEAGGAPGLEKSGCEGPDAAKDFFDRRAGDLRDRDLRVVV